MAKQTFTTGQVLTAAQMTSLQQTAMGGGEATAKTASYVLTAADAGTTVIMNAAGATTITVNTALFAAGDTVNIQNVGAGVCTVTAGTATVNTAGSLDLSQYEGGVLYFRSTSASTFFDYVQASAAPSNANFTLINAGGTALTGATTVTVTGLAGNQKLLIYVVNASSANASSIFTLRFNTDSTTKYDAIGRYFTSTSAQDGEFAGTAPTATSFELARQGNAAGSAISAYTYVDGANATGLKTINSDSYGNGTSYFAYTHQGTYVGTSVISSISIISSTGNLDAGTVYVYGSGA